MNNAKSETKPAVAEAKTGFIETKSELKVIWVCVALVGAALLGVDVGAFLDPITADSVKAVAGAGSDLVANHDRLGLAGYLAALGSVYVAGRSLVKAVRSWVERRPDVVLPDPEQDGD